MNLAVTKPQIIEHEVGKEDVMLSLFLPKNLHYFEGHFPHISVLPGVVQLHWAMEYANEFFGLGLDYDRVDALKFQHVLFAEQTVSLTLKWKPEKQQMLFRYFSEKGQHSSGRVVFQDNDV